MAVHDSNNQCSPDPNKWVEARGHRKSRCFRNDMDASEALDKRPFYQACGGDHLGKNCNAYPTHRLPDGTKEWHIPKCNSRV